MRKIKFRAWLPDKKIFVPYELGREYNENEFEDAIYQQYTGVNDKNGKEIKIGNCGSTFRLATQEEIEESKKVHAEGKCDAGFCTGVFYDRAAYAYDTRHCAICHNMIGLI